jgi:ferredoxin--NADP+ reductase
MGATAQRPARVVVVGAGPAGLYAAEELTQQCGVSGEDLAGSFSATEFVAWYSGYPDAEVDAFTLDARTVAVIGVGNVAVDVTRILAKTTAELRATDMPVHVLDVLDASTITDIHMVGRRGPVQAKFTTKELRELGELANADIVVRPDELVLDEASEALVASDKALRRNLELLQEWSQRPQQGKPRRIHLRFLLAPIHVAGSVRVEGLEMGRVALDGSGGAVPTGETVALPAELLLRSVGYRGLPLPDVPFDGRAGVIPHIDGRVQRDGRDAVGEYVVGWIKRGPSGVIGTNRADARETVGGLLVDLPALPPAPIRDPEAVIVLLAQRGVGVVTQHGSEAISAAEEALGRATGRTRVKIVDRDELVAAAAGQQAS